MATCQNCGNSDKEMHSVLGECLLPAKPGYPKQDETPEEYLKTTSWTDEQQAEVDAWVQRTADEIAKDVEVRKRRITFLDKRPHKVWTEEQPNVFFRYVAQGMLEDLIAELASRV